MTARGRHAELFNWTRVGASARGVVPRILRTTRAVTAGWQGLVAVGFIACAALLTGVLRHAFRGGAWQRLRLRET
jgi:hypothetical protein